MSGILFSWITNRNLTFLHVNGWDELITTHPFSQPSLPPDLPVSREGEEPTTRSTCTPSSFDPPPTSPPSPPDSCPCCLLPHFTHPHVNLSVHRTTMFVPLSLWISWALQQDRTVPLCQENALRTPWPGPWGLLPVWPRFACAVSSTSIQPCEPALGGCGVSLVFMALLVPLSILIPAPASPNCSYFPQNELDSHIVSLCLQNCSLSLFLLPGRLILLLQALDEMPGPPGSLSNHPLLCPLHCVTV